MLHIGFVIAAALLDVAANMALNKSKGFKRKRWGFLSILLVMSAFTLLTEAVRGMDLAVAYASWGAIGILGTAIGSWIIFKEKLKPIGWAGIVVIATSVVVMHSA
ncbi:MAG: SMR family transporter [Plesiomonas sp.]|uniref:SMR family transporter n=2 Tax=Plesiomonas sp. TaxID=2486279 RepID=UPI003EE4BC9C